MDTNVLLYAYDADEPEKQPRAEAALNHLVQAGSGALSVQVLGEFFSVATRKLVPPLTREEAAAAVEDYLAAWPVLGLDDGILRTAVRGAARYQLSYYDALVWATARENGVPLVISEDCQVGRTIEGVTFVDPLVDGFDLSILG